MNDNQKKNFETLENAWIFNISMSIINKKTKTLS